MANIMLKDRAVLSIDFDILAAAVAANIESAIGRVSFEVDTLGVMWTYSFRTKSMANKLQTFELEAEEVLEFSSVEDAEDSRGVPDRQIIGTLLLRAVDANRTLYEITRRQARLLQPPAMDASELEDFRNPLEAFKASLNDPDFVAARENEADLASYFDDVLNCILVNLSRLIINERQLAIRPTARSISTPIPDFKPTRLQSKIIDAVSSLRAEGLNPTDEMVATRVPASRNGLSYTREWINHQRGMLRKNKFDV